jgi:hypothetical protein
VTIKPCTSAMSPMPKKDRGVVHFLQSATSYALAPLNAPDLSIKSDVIAMARRPAAIALSPIPLPAFNRRGRKNHRPYRYGCRL